MAAEMLSSHDKSNRFHSTKAKWSEPHRKPADTQHDSSEKSNYSKHNSVDIWIHQIFTLQRLYKKIILH